MKNLTKSLLILIVVSLSVITSCKKDSDPDTVPTASLDHKIIFKATSNPDSWLMEGAYTDDAGGKKTFGFSGGPYTFTSDELIISATAKTINFTMKSTAEANKSKPFLTVEIWVDGVKKAESTTNGSVITGGYLTATTTYTF
jgi:hypothetical protein